jgi:predicted RND superfamily exporter protein
VVELIEKAIRRYSQIITNRPGTVLVLITMLTVALAAGATSIETVNQSNEDFLPDTIESVRAFDIIGAEFGRGGGGSTYTVLFETSPNYANSTEIRDVRNPELLRYIETISNDLSKFNDVVMVSSPTDLVDNPSTTREASKQLRESGEVSRFISDDYSFAIIRITSADIPSGEEEKLASRIKTAVEQNDKPSGIEVGYTGSPFINQAFQQESQSTQGQTSLISLIGVFLVVILLFRSVTNGLTSLSALIFGIVSGFGLYGWMGMNLSPATSGAISMGMGIAIDFGIQTVSRYREEREDHGIQKSLEKMIAGVIKPMTIALIAAVIGFTALSFGRITFLSSLGTMLTLTTVFAYIGALTLIPVLLVLHDKYLKNYLPENLYSRINPLNT